MRGGRVIAATDLARGVPSALAHVATPSGSAIRAWKVAIPQGEDRWTALSGRASYGPLSDAICLSPDPASRTHSGAPHRSCTCGLHGVTDPAALPLSLAPEGAVLLDVRLGGRIVAHEWHLGSFVIRAERQEVLEVHPLAAGELPDAPRLRHAPLDLGARVAAVAGQ
ncbi:MAG: hypothetical protein ACI867_002429 [Glaciecola sp.]|jgi:hypothetical protein